MTTPTAIHREAAPQTLPRTNTATWRAPLAFLLVSGTLLGVTTNMAKLASQAGLAPLPFLTWSMVGAAAMLLALAAHRRTLPRLERRTSEYLLVSALLTVVLPQLLFFSAVPHVGAGFVALAIAFPPLLTYAGALLLRMERFDPVRGVGVTLALAGAVAIASPKLSASEPGAIWAIAALAGPVFLAAGNLYRTLRWPQNARAEALAPGMLGAAAGLLLLLGAVSGDLFDLPTRDYWLVSLILAQTVVFAVQYLVFFQLQKCAGPVYLSLLGSVGAAVGVPVAIFALGEAPPEGLAIAVTLIAAGVTLITWASGSAWNRRAEKSPRP